MTFQAPLDEDRPHVLSENREPLGHSAGMIGRDGRAAFLCRRRRVFRPQRQQQASHTKSTRRQKEIDMGPRSTDQQTFILLAM